MGLAERADAGKLGEMNDWIEAEQRWITAGISEADIRYLVDAEAWPFDERIATIGFAGWGGLPISYWIPRSIRSG